MSLKFRANFDFSPKVSFAPINIVFTNTSTVGDYVSTESMFVDDYNNVIENFTPDITSLFANVIEKYSWDFGDGEISGDKSLEKMYKFSGVYTIGLSIISERIYDSTTGIYFRIKNTTYKTIEIGSMVVSWLKSHMTTPHVKALETSPGFKDLIYASSKMFDRMYKDITDVANLMDVEKVPSEFLVYFSDTLNHARFYSEKIGYSEQADDSTFVSLFDYSIFDRIADKTASEQEISKFRQFLIDSSALFKQKGSIDSLNALFKLYEISTRIKEMWTGNFEQTSVPKLVDDFLFNSILTDTNNKFKFHGITVAGWDNSVCQIWNPLNKLNIDNYHFSTNHSYSSDQDETLSNSCNVVFPINDYTPNILNVTKLDGSPVNMETVLENECDYSSIEPNVGYSIKKNEDYLGFNVNTSGSITKIWNAPENYVQQVITIYGDIPNDVPESDESGITGNESDDFLWANWKTGVTVPDAIIGVSKSSLRTPSSICKLPGFNYSSTSQNPNLFNVETTKVNTKGDFFAISRGFIEIEDNGYYNFYLDVGNKLNEGFTSINKNVGLFSLKKTPLTKEEITKLPSLDDIEFARISGSKTEIIQDDINGEHTLDIKNTEYGLIEIRQNEYEQNSSWVKLSPGFYVYEVKTTYGNYDAKRLKISYDSWNSIQSGVNTTFVNVIEKQPIPENILSNIVENPQSVQNTVGKGLLTVPTKYLRKGETVKVSYVDPLIDSNVISGIISQNKVKNFESVFRIAKNDKFKLDEVASKYENYGSFQYIFRATNINVNSYYSIDAYYSVNYNGKDKEISISYVTYNKDIDDAVYRYLNLDKSSLKDKITYTIPLLDSNGHRVSLDSDTYYKFKIIVNDNNVSIYYLQDLSYTELTNNYSLTDGSILCYSEDNNYTTVIENVELYQEKNMTSVFDKNGNTIVTSDKYINLEEPGAYGFAVQNSSIDIKTFSMDSSDLQEENLLDTTEKWKKIKPKWLDNKSAQRIMKLNSYDVGDSSGTDFPYVLTENYTGESVYQFKTNDLTAIDDNAIDSLYADNISAKDWCSILNMSFDADIMSSTFETEQDVYDNIRISIGQFFEPFIDWARPTTSYPYNHSGSAGYMPIVYEKSHILPHTVASENNTVKEYISSLTRIKNTLSLNTTLNTIIKSDPSTVKYLGVWEEMCPLSTSRLWTINNSSIKNEVFSPIYQDNTKVESQRNIIGVRIVSEDVYKDLACRYCEGATVWGLYDVVFTDQEIPANCIKLTNDQPKTSTIKYFIPIGKLQSDNYIMLPPIEFLRTVKNVKINLTGVYAHRDYAGMTFVEDDNVIINVSDQNKWEIKNNNKILCKYFLDVEVDLVEKLSIDQKVDQTSTAECVTTLPTIFYYTPRMLNIIKLIECEPTFQTLFNWWMPKNVWVNQKYETVYPKNDGSTILTGIGGSNENYKSLGLKLITTKIPSSTKYLLQSKWCVSSVGWDHEYADSTLNDEGVSLFEFDDIYQSIGFDSSELRFTLDIEKIIKVNDQMVAPLPIETFDDGNTFLNAMYILSNTCTDTNKTFSPVGMFNWYDAHSTKKDFLVNPDSRIGGWDIQDWNQNFIDCFTPLALSFKLPSDSMTLNKYLVFNKDTQLAIGSVVKLICKYGNGEKKVKIGVAKNNNQYFDLPALYSTYSSWKLNVNDVIVDNFKIPNEYYYSRINTSTNTPEIVLNNQQYDFTKFLNGAKLTVNIYYDKAFNLNETVKIVDNFSDARDIGWVTHVETDKLYTVASRSPDLWQKFTNQSLPYNIVTYKNSSCMQLADKFTEKSSNAYAGSVTTEVEVGLNNNSGKRDVLYLIDTESNDYELSCDVIFDKNIVNNSYEKKFEIIVKAENSYDYSTEQWGITGFYYIGIGTNNFDVSIGMRKYDQETKELKDTYLASFGDYNVQNIMPDVWYTLSVKVSGTNIKVYINSKGEDRKLVLNYNINKKYEKLTERYLKGQWDTLEAILVGLNELKMTYPAKLGDTVSSEYTYKNFKEEFAATIPINGSFTGIRLFNPMTYVGNVRYTINKPKKYTMGSTIDVVSIHDFLVDIQDRFGIPENSDIKKFERSLDFVEYVQINDSLYWRVNKGKPEKYSGIIETFYRVQDKIFVIEKKYKPDTGVGINIWTEGDYSITWAIEPGSDEHKTYRSFDFFNYIENLIRVDVYRNEVSNIAEKTESGINGDNVYLVPGDTIIFFIDCGGENCSITWSLNGNVVLYDKVIRCFSTKFNNEYPILIKDLSFYADSVNYYQTSIDKKLDNVIINDNRLNLFFKDM